MRSIRRVVLLLAGAVGSVVALVSAQDGVVTTSPRTPAVQLLPANPLALPAPADSNSPAVWDLIDGQPRLVLMPRSPGSPPAAQGAPSSA